MDAAPVEYVTKAINKGEARANAELKNTSYIAQDRFTHLIELQEHELGGIAKSFSPLGRCQFVKLQQRRKV